MNLSRSSLRGLAGLALSLTCFAQQPPEDPQRPGFPPPGFPPPGFQGPGDQGPGGQGPGGRGGGMPRNEKTEVLAQFDADENGRLDREERAEAKVWLAENRQQRGGRRPGGRRGPPGMPGSEEGRGEAESGEPRTRKTVRPRDVETFEDHPFFDTDIVRTVFLDFDHEDWSEELSAFYSTDVLVPATVTIDGEIYDEVGVRFRGNTSYMRVRGEKKSFDLEFDFVHDKQDVQGVRNLDLLNCNQDASMMREALHGWISNQYLPAQRVTLMRVVVNRQDFGIYAAVEAFDRGFLEAHFDSKKGDRFKVPPDFSGGGGLRFLGEEPEAYEKNYQLKSKADETAWAGLVDLCAVLEHTETEDLQRILPQHLAVDTALWFLAVDNAVGDDDGYHSRASDYVLYRDPKGRFHPMARDNNEILLGERRSPPGGRAGAGTDRGNRRSRRPGGRGMSRATSPLQMAGRQDRPLLRRLLEVPEWRERYLANLRELATGAMSPKRIGARIEAWREAIEPVVAEDAHFEAGLEAFARETATSGPAQAADSSLLAIIEKRRRMILDDASMQGPWPEAKGVAWELATDAAGEQALHVHCQVGGATIARVLLHHDDGKFGAFATAIMHDDGEHGDGAAGDGTYGGWLPASEAGKRWRFWVEAIAAESGHVDCQPAGGGALPFRWRMPKN